MSNQTTLMILGALLVIVLGLYVFTSANLFGQHNGTTAILDTLAPLPAATGGVAVGADGNVYVADIGAAPDRNGQRVYRVTPNGEVEIFVQDHLILGASGNAFDAQGNLYQSSLRHSQIVKISPDGGLSIFANSNQGVTNPVGLVFDEEGTLFVANCGGGNVLILNSDGEQVRTINSALFNCPNGIALDDEKNIYVANFSNGNVLKIDAESFQTEIFVTLPGNNNGHITWADGFFYLVDRGGARIYTLSLDGDLEPFAATGERGHVDGPVGVAQISLPNDLGISPDGDILYFNDAEPTTGSLNQPSFLKRIMLNPDEN